MITKLEQLDRYGEDVDGTVMSAPDDGQYVLYSSVVDLVDHMKKEIKQSHQDCIILTEKLIERDQRIEQLKEQLQEVKEEILERLERLKS